MSGTTAPHIVLVHGAWSGGWTWKPVTDALRERGFEVTVVRQLPSGTGDPQLGLRADAEVLRETINALDGTVVLVGHSYGGMVITQLAGDPRVAAAVYATAFLPKRGSNFIETAGGKLAPWIEIDESAGVSRIAEAAAAKVVAPGMTPEEAAPIVAKLVPQSLASFNEASEGAGWGPTPVTYLICTEDRVIPEAAQRAMAANEPNARLVEIACDHYPAVSATDTTVEAIVAAAQSAQLS